MQFNELKQTKQFTKILTKSSILYEQKLNELINQLIEKFKEINSILDRILQEKQLKTSLKEKISNISKDFQKIIDESNILIQKIIDALFLKIEILDYEKLSDRIQIMIDIAINTKQKFDYAKENNKLNDTDIRLYNTMKSNIKLLGNKILEYNSFFKNQILTIQTARKIFFIQRGF